MKLKRRAFVALLTFIVLSFISSIVLMRQKFFGKNPFGERLKKIMKSRNYKNEEFQNLSETSVTLKDASYVKMMREFFNKPKTTEPPKPLPSVKTDLKNLKSEAPSIVWFGHSTYFIKSK